VATFGSSQVWTYPDIDRLVHELGRPEHLHRHCGHFSWSGFINGLRTQGISLFLWGVAATTLPLILGMYVGKYIFRFHDAILLGILSGPAPQRLRSAWYAIEPKAKFPLLVTP